MENRNHTNTHNAVNNKKRKKNPILQAIKLLERKFMFWPKENLPKVTTLNQILISAEEQVTRYMKVIANGPVQNGKPGIVDSRAVIKRPSNYNGVLNCYVIMVIGFRRLVFRSVGSQSTPYSITKK
ncbi:19064_t:CDS:2 [Cetraspora pellucida]|uniref:19064_t:CDS:1 n=1 Tax=Cetraspora pellucida TaxID=1433469 RepID=A0A9N8ZDV7_9GLOM|nr:19064_t:CDS:2 [Cetraspora pellucida]